jgi:Cu(I)/Ag(I) efflux system periplasmic protein CusF
MIRRVAAALLPALLAFSAFAQSALTEGVVRKVDKANGKITLKHGDIKNLDMPPMTMVFSVPDKALLDQVKAGDKVRFAADKDASGQYIVTGIEPAR